MRTWITPKNFMFGIWVAVAVVACTTPTHDPNPNPSTSASPSTTSSPSQSQSPKSCGEPPCTCSVVLTWNASTSNDVVAYNIYQASQSGGPWGDAVPVGNNTTYTFYNVCDGDYYYVATALAPNPSTGVDQESAYSNQASVTITAPAAPAVAQVKSAVMHVTVGKHATTNSAEITVNPANTMPNPTCNDCRNSLVPEVKKNIDAANQVVTKIVADPKKIPRVGVVSASWGENLLPGNHNNILAAVQDMCKDVGQCEFTVADLLEKFADPSPGKDKSISVQYFCMNHLDMGFTTMSLPKLSSGSTIFMACSN